MTNYSKSTCDMSRNKIQFTRNWDKIRYLFIIKHDYIILLYSYEKYYLDEVIGCWSFKLGTHKMKTNF